MIPVVLLAALSFVGGLGRGAIGDNDEAFYAESAREMVESGDWITPRFNYEPRFQKPALYYWLTAALFAVTGPHEFAARLWSALAGIGLVLVTTACAPTLVRRERGAARRSDRRDAASATSLWRGCRCPICRSRFCVTCGDLGGVCRHARARTQPAQLAVARGGGGRGWAS